MSFCFFLGISCPSRPLHPLIASLAVQHHPPSTQNPAASKRSWLHQRKKNKSLQLSGNSKHLFLNCLMVGFVGFFLVSFGRRDLSKHLEREADCVGEDLIWFPAPNEVENRAEHWVCDLPLDHPAAHKQGWDLAMPIPGSAHQTLKLCCGSQQQLISCSHSNCKVLQSKVQEKMLSTTTFHSLTKQKSS